ALEARGAATGTVRRVVRIAEGSGSTPITLSLVPAASTPVATREATPGSRAPGFVTLGIGVAGLALGAVTGARRMTKAWDVKSRCQGTHCLTTDEPEGHAASTLATLSTIGFVAGGAAGVTGIVLLITRPGGSSPTGARPPQASRTSELFAPD